MYNFKLINADTDSIMVAKLDETLFSEEEQEKLLNELNGMFPEHINWDADGFFESVIVVKAKNYVMKEYGTNKVKTKGSGLKDTKKEPAMREMMDKMVDAMLNDRQNTLLDIYKSYVKEALNVTDITRWSTKKTITEAITKCGNPKETVRKQEKDVWDAIKDEEDKQEGNKILLYPVVLGVEVISGRVGKKGQPLKDLSKEITGLKLAKHWNNDHNVNHLLKRCYATVLIFQNILNMDLFVDYSKSSNKKYLEELK